MLGRSRWTREGLAEDSGCGSRGCETVSVTEGAYEYRADAKVFVKFGSSILRSFLKRSRDRVSNKMKDHVRARKTFLETLK